MRSITSTTLSALGLCPHSSKIKQVVLTWVLPDLMSTSASSSARSFCGRRPQEAPIGNWEVRRRKEGSEYTVCFQISHHCGQLQLSPLGNSERWCGLCLRALSSKGQGSEATGPPTSRPSLTEYYFRGNDSLALLAFPVCKAQRGPSVRKKKALGRVTGVGSKQPSEWEVRAEGI